MILIIVTDILLEQLNEKKPEVNANGYEYVDLGLSVLWATCNVGASKPEEYGGYYGWGCPYNDPTGYYSPFNENFPIERDIAHNVMGGDWRMPTKEEFEELVNNTTQVYTSLNSWDGFKFTASNGNSIFLPACGYYGDGIQQNVTTGKYWSSSYGEFTNSYLLDCSFDNYVRCAISVTAKSLRFNVRGVLPKS